MYHLSVIAKWSSFHLAIFIQFKKNPHKDYSVYILKLILKLYNLSADTLYIN
jgi:hypothetical protein